MKKENSWSLFLLGIGCLIIMTAPQTPDPGTMLFGGILVVIMAVLWMIRKKKNKKNSES